MFLLRKQIWLPGLILVFGLALAACGGGAAQPTAPGADATTAPTEVPPTPAATIEPTLIATEVLTQEATQPAAEPSPTPEPFTATIRGLAIDPADNIELASAGGSGETVQLAITGLHVIPPGMPAYFQAGAINTADGAKLSGFEWTLQGPDGSNAQVEEVTAEQAEITGPGVMVFTPDQPGTYVLGLTVTDDQGNTSQAAEMNVEAALYVGAANCQNCHANQFNSWSETGHGTFFTRMVNEDPSGAYAEQGFQCARCHTVGYHEAATASIGGWWDVAVNQLNFEWPTEQIGQPDAFETAFPEELQTLSNIQCENCHGPGGNHNGDPTKTATSIMTGQCDQCHNNGQFYTTGEQFDRSVHLQNANLGSVAARAECAKCHSPVGFIDFVDGVEEENVRNTAGPIACATCHDPHDDENPSQVRLVGDVLGAPIEITDQGLSALCATCHNARTTAEGVVDGDVSFPHYSAAAEAINNAGGYDFGVEIPNSPHSMIGQQEDDNGVIEGACVYCHMGETPGGSRNVNTENGTDTEVTDETNPGHNLIGGHTFNMVAERENGERVELVSTCTECHQDVTTFNFTADADYDGNGQVEGVQTEVAGLLGLVQQALEDQGVEFVEGYPYMRLPENASEEINGAAYNWRYVVGVVPIGEGRASAIHNFDRSVALLQVSYQRLTGQDVQNATILYQ